MSEAIPPSEIASVTLFLRNDAGGLSEQYLMSRWLAHGHETPVMSPRPQLGERSLAFSPPLPSGERGWVRGTFGAMTPQLLHLHWSLQLSSKCCPDFDASAT